MGLQKVDLFPKKVCKRLTLSMHSGFLYNFFKDQTYK